jgi:hypothetical protein
MNMIFTQSVIKITQSSFEDWVTSLALSLYRFITKLGEAVGVSISYT